MLGFPVEQVVRVAGLSVLVYGPFRFTIRDHRIDGQWSRPWLALTYDTVDNLTELTCRASQLVTIENLSAFEAHIWEGLPSDTVALYTGGFPGYLEHQMILKLREAGVKRVSHWGDLDYDGLRILRHMAQSLNTAVVPYRMEPELLDTLPTLPRTHRERVHLTQWITDETAPCKSLVRKMLDTNRKAEQESWYLKR